MNDNAEFPFIEILLSHYSLHDLPIWMSLTAVLRDFTTLIFTYY